MESYRQVLNPEACHCTPEIKARIIRNIPFLKNASESTLGELVRLLKSQSMVEGQEISPLKYPAGVFCIVAGGTFKVKRWISDEQFVIFDLLTQGDFFLYSSGDGDNPSMYVYPDIVQTMTTCCLLTMDLSKLLPVLTKDPAVFPQFLRHLTQRLGQINERFIRFMAFQAEHRIAYLLLTLHGKGPRKRQYPGLIPFTLTRKDLASMSGLTLETASRILSGMERDQLIHSGRGWIEIVDFSALESLCKTEPF